MSSVCQVPVPVPLAFAVLSCRNTDKRLLEPRVGNKIRLSFLPPGFPPHPSSFWGLSSVIWSTCWWTAADLWQNLGKIPDSFWVVWSCRLFREFYCPSFESPADLLLTARSCSFVFLMYHQLPRQCRSKPSASFQFLKTKKSTNDWVQ